MSTPSTVHRTDRQFPGIDTYSGQGVRFFAPDVAFDDAEKYLPLLLKKRGKPHADLSASLEHLRNIIEAVTPELYAVFESEARQRLRGRDESDLPILATALGLACAVWTGDADFFGTGARFGRLCFGTSASSLPVEASRWQRKANRFSGFQSLEIMKFDSFHGF